MVAGSIIGLALATVTFTLGLFADLTLSPLLFSFKNIVATVAAPLEVLVSLLYWSLYAVCMRHISFPSDFRS